MRSRRDFAAVLLASAGSLSISDGAAGQTSSDNDRAASADAGEGVVDIRSLGADPSLADNSALIQPLLDRDVPIFVPKGEWRVNLTVPSGAMIIGAGIGQTTLMAVASSNRDVLKGDGFDELTGKDYADGDILRGARRTVLENLTIDGDKATNTEAGWGIRVWGGGHRWTNLKVQNCCEGGIWTEFTTHDAGTVDDDLEGYFTSIQTIQNDGNGWTFHGPHDSHIVNFGSFGNAGWAFQSGRGGTLHAATNWNSWLNTLGSFDFGSTVGHGAGWAATGDNRGVGVRFNPGIGSCIINDVMIAGHDIGLYLHGSNHSISGTIQRCGLGLDGVAGIVVDDPLACQISVNGIGNKVDVHVQSDALGASFWEGIFTQVDAAHALTTGVAFHPFSRVRLQHTGLSNEVVQQNVAVLPTGDRPVVRGSKEANEALTSLIEALQGLGLIHDSTI